MIDSNDGAAPARWRSKRALGAMSIAAVLAVAACSSIDDEPEVDGEPELAEPSSGGTLTVGRLSDILSLDGNFIGADQYILLNNVYDRLIQYDANLEPQPALAESWATNDDFTELTVQLREGVTFHDGKPFTSADVVYTLERVRDPEVGASQLATLSNTITDIDAPDDQTLVLQFDEPTPGIFDMLNLMAIVDQETVEGPDAEQTANGTGAYRFEEWAPGNRLVLSRNENYWDDVYLDQIELVVIGDAQSLGVQVESGAVDVAENIVAQDAQRLMSQGLTIVDDPADMHYIAVNTANPPLDDPQVRQAINYAIDRQRFADEVMQGLVEPTSLVWPHNSPAHDESKAETYSYNLDEAAKLLDDAGVEDLSLELITNAAFPALEDLGTILQSDLAQIGVELQVRNLQAPEWRELAFSASYEGLAANIYGVSAFQPAYAFRISRPLTSDDNFSNFSNPQLEDLIQAATTAVDDAERARTLDELGDFMLGESHVMPVSPAPRLTAVGEGAAGVDARIGGGLDLRQAYVEEE